MHKDCVASRTEETGLTNPAALDRACGSGARAAITALTYIHARFRGEGRRSYAFVGQAVEFPCDGMASK